jgi:hypothetical protein
MRILKSIPTIEDVIADPQMEELFFTDPSQSQPGYIGAGLEKQLMDENVCFLPGISVFALYCQRHRVGGNLYIRCQRNPTQRVAQLHDISMVSLK